MKDAHDGDPAKRSAEFALRIVPMFVGSPDRRAPFTLNKVQKNYRLSDELLVTANTLSLAVTPGLGLRQAFADAAGQKPVVWDMNRQAETAAEMCALFENLFMN